MVNVISCRDVKAHLKNRASQHQMCEVFTFHNDLYGTKVAIRGTFYRHFTRQYALQICIQSTTVLVSIRVLRKHQLATTGGENL